MKQLTTKQLENFDFKFLRHVTGGLYEIVDGKEFAEEVNADKPHVIDDDRIAFWTDDCEDHAHVVHIGIQYIKYGEAIIQ